MSAAPDARVVLRPRGLLEGADLALRFVMTERAPYFRLLLLVGLPGLLLSLVLRYALDAAWFWVWLASFALAVCAEGAFTALSGQLVLRSEVTAAGALRAFAPRALPYIVLRLFSVVAQTVGLFMALVPGIFVAMAVVYVPEVVILERVGFGAFRRAGRISSGQGVRGAGLVMVLWGARLGTIVLAELTLRTTLGVLLEVRLPTESLWSDGGSPYALLGLWLSVPFCAALRYFSYIDLRTLKEGWDVQRRLQRLATELAQEAR